MKNCLPKHRRLFRNGQFADDDGLDIVGLLITGIRPGIAVLVDLAVAPHTLCAHVQVVLHTAAEGGAIHSIVDTCIIETADIVIGVHHLLGASGDWIRKVSGLVPPNHGLDPGVHVTGHTCIPLGSSKGFSFIGKGTRCESIVIGHEIFDRGIIDGLGTAPGLTLQGPAHAFAMVGTEAIP